MSLNYNENAFSLTSNCMSTGLPPTTVTWRKNGMEMSSGDSYTISQRVIDVDSTVYENMMIIDRESVCDMQGLYQCFVQCYDDIGGMMNSVADSVSGTDEFDRVIICKLVKIMYQNLISLLQSQVVFHLVCQAQ